MASVYRSRQETFDRDVAIKVLAPNLSQDANFIARFNREVKIIAQLQHPNIVPVFDYGTERDGTVYLVMRLIEGGGLDRFLSKGPIQIRETTRILGQIAGALDYAHGRNVVHRDVKPSNILLDAQVNGYLTDFGIAKPIADTAQGLTATGMMMGTPEYMSPEQWRDEELTGRSDVYSLGIMLYKMLTGQVPFTGRTMYQYMTAHLSNPLPSVLAVRPDLPADVDEILQRATAKELSARYTSTVEFAEDFSAVVAHLITRRTSSRGGVGSGSMAALTPEQIAEYERQRAANPSTPTPYPIPNPTPLPTQNPTVLVTPSSQSLPVQQPTPPKPNRTGIWIGLGVLLALILGISSFFVASELTRPTVSPTLPATLTQIPAVAVNPTTVVPSPVNTDLPVPATRAATNTAIPPTFTLIPPTNTAPPPTLTSTVTSLPPTATLIPPTFTPIPPTFTPIPPTATSIPPTATSIPPTLTPIPPTLTLTPTPLPPTLTFTPTATPIPPTRTQPPTLTLTPTPIPPTLTLTFTATSLPPTATFPPTPIPTSALPTQPQIPMTATINGAVVRSGLMTYGDTVEGVIDSERSLSVWKFIGGYGDQVQIVMISTSGSLLPVVRVIDSKGNFIDWNDNGGTLRSVPLPSDGEYTIIASRRNLENGKTIGSYTLNLSLVSQGIRPTPTVTITLTPTLTPTITPSLTITPSVTPVRALYYGASLASFLPNNSAVDQWTFIAQTGDVIDIATEAIQFKERRYGFTLSGPTFATEQNAPQGNLTGVSIIAGGTYTIRVSGQVGQYRLSLKRVQSGQNPTPIPDVIRYGDTLRSQSLNSNFTAVIRNFDGHAGEVISISARPTSGSPDPVLELFGTEGQVLVKVDDSYSDYGAGIENYTLPKDGVYRIQVSRYSRTNGGTFDLKLTLQPSAVLSLSTYPPTALIAASNNRLYPGDTKNGTLSAYGSYTYTFLGRRGENVRGYVVRKSNTLEPVLKLTDNTTGRTLYETNVAVRQTQDDVLQARTLPSSGRYTLSVSAKTYAANSGDYRLDFSYTAPIPALEVDKVLTGTLDAENPQRVYTLNGVAGQYLQIAANTDVGSKTDTLVMLIAPNDHLITFSDNIGNTDTNALINGIQLQETGTYKVVVTRPGGDDGESVGRFKLSYKVLSDPPAAAWKGTNSFNLQGGGIVGEFAQQSNQAWVFEGKIGDLIELETSRLYGEGSVSLGTLLDPDGKALDPIGTAGGTGTYKLVKAGSYTITVNGANLHYALWGKVIDNSPPLPELLRYNMGTVTGKLPARTRQVLKFNGKTDDQLNLLVFWLPGPERNFEVFVTTPDNRTFAMPLTEPALTSAKLTTRLTTSGTYQLVINNTSSTETTFNIQLEGVNAAPSPTPFTTSLSSGQTVTDTLSPLGSKVYRFLGRSNQRVYLALELKGNKSPELQVLTPDGTPLKNGVAQADGYTLFDAVLPVNGQYTVTVISQDNVASGNYRFTFALTTTDAPPTPTIEATVDPLALRQISSLPINSSVSGIITPPGEASYQFDGKTGDTALFSLYVPSTAVVPIVGATPPVGPTLAPTALTPVHVTLTVYDPNGNYVAEATSSGVSDRTRPVLQVPLTKTGKYSVVLRSRGGSRQAQYFLTFINQPPNSTATATPLKFLPFEEIQNDMVRVGDREISWRYQPKATSVLFVLRPRPNSTLQAQLDVVTKEGFLEYSLSATRPGEELRIPIAKLSSDDYRIIVRSLNGTAGEYSLYVAGNLNGIVVFNTKALSVQALRGPNFNQFPLQTNIFGANFEAFGRSTDGKWLLMRNPNKDQSFQYVWVLISSVQITYGDPSKLPIEQPVTR
jgi:serine/threonine-protein kinase